MPAWLRHLERPLGQAVPESLDGEVGGGLGVPGGAERHEQRREVVDGRVGVAHRRRAIAEVQQLVHGPALQRLRCPGVELVRPAGGGAAGSLMSMYGSPWVRNPLPMMSTPSSRRGARRWP